MKQWKEINGFNGLYSINNLGVVKNNITGRIIKTKLTKNGYTRIGLHKDKKQYNFYVHRLLMSEFCTIEGNDIFQINHKNKIKTDNRLENLEWVTLGENIIHRDSFSKKIFLELIEKLVPFQLNKKIA